VKHPNVVSFREAFIDHPSETMCIVMDYCEMGDLQEIMQKAKKMGSVFSEHQLWSFLVQMLAGLRALHQLSVMHRDVKTANIMMTQNG
jgi:NIMA (never in mitosis gene a)-related kinase